MMLQTGKEFYKLVAVEWLTFSLGSAGPGFTTENQATFTIRLPRPVST